jgi:hypothetical protein
MYPKFSYTLCVGDTGSIYIRKLDYVSLPHRKKNFTGRYLLNFSGGNKQCVHSYEALLIYQTLTHKSSILYA